MVLMMFLKKVHPKNRFLFDIMFVIDPGNGTGTDDKSYRAAAVHALCLNVSDSVAYQPHRNNKHNTLDVPGLTGAKRNLTHLCLAF